MGLFSEGVGLLAPTIKSGVKAGSGLIDEATDYVKDLMFLHGTTPEKLNLYDEIGGLPMPSMAVTQKDIPFNWGDIDLVGKPDNFDPRLNSLNDLFSADAYTIRGKEPFKIPNKNAWKLFDDDFHGSEGASMAPYLIHKLENSATKAKSGPEAYRIMNEFFHHRGGGGYAKFANENSIEIPTNSMGSPSVLKLKHIITENHGEAYNKWASDKIDSYFQPEWFYKDNSNKTKLYDADAMSKLMKKERGKGTEGITSGEGYERAMEATKFKSLDDARSNKGLLMPAEKAKQMFSEMDYQDGLPPTSYFESKPARTVGLDEFAGAIVPDFIDERSLRTLQNRGLQVETYKDAASRLAARDKFKSEMFTNPIATAAAGAGGILAMSASDDSEAGVVSSGKKAVSGLLDMSTPARMQRADDMGFDRDIYHKTWSDTFDETGFESFDPKKMQTSDYGYAGKGIYSTPEPLGGTTYGNITMPLKTNIKNPYVMTADNFQDEITPYQWIPKNEDKYGSLSASSDAWTKMMQDKGYDGFVDGASKNGEVVVFSPSNIRSKFAKFDPAKASSSNLLASNPAATLGAGILGNTIGQESSGLLALQQGRDALLTPQESQYLRNHAALQETLGTKDNEKFKYGNLLPMKIDRESGDYSLAMTGLLRDIIEAGYDVGQSRKTGIQNPQSIWDIIL